MKAFRFGRHRMRRPNTAVLAVASCALAIGASLAGATGADAATAVRPAANLTCGEVISASVTLTGNLHCTGNGLIVSPDNDVVLNLGGYTVSGAGTGTGVTLASADVPYEDYTVENGAISGFTTDVFADNVQSATVNNVKLSGDTNAVQAGSGLSSLDVTGSKITTSTTDFQTTSARFLTELAVTGTTITGGTDSFTDGLATAFYTSDHITDSALYLNTGGNDQIEDNVFTDSAVREQSSGGQLQITGNEMDNAAIGLLVQSTGADVISGNTFKNNVIGAEISETEGIQGDTFSSNTFSGNKDSGLYIDSTLANVGTITSNTVTSNGLAPDGQVDATGHPLIDGIDIDQPASGGVSVKGNHTKKDGGFGIWIQEGSVTNGGGNTSTNDPDGCNPHSLCTY